MWILPKKISGQPPSSESESDDIETQNIILPNQIIKTIIL